MRNYAEFQEKYGKKITKILSDKEKSTHVLTLKTNVITEMVKDIALDFYLNLNQQQENTYINTINKKIDPDGIYSTASERVSAWKYLKESVAVALHNLKDPKFSSKLVNYCMEQINIEVSRKLLNDINEELKQKPMTADRLAKNVEKAMMKLTRDDSLYDKPIESFNLVPAAGLKCQVREIIQKYMDPEDTLEELLELIDKTYIIPFLPTPLEKNPPEDWSKPEGPVIADAYDARTQKEMIVKRNESEEYDIFIRQLCNEGVHKKDEKQVNIKSFTDQADAISYMYTKAAEYFGGK